MSVEDRLGILRPVEEPVPSHASVVGKGVDLRRHRQRGYGPGRQIVDMIAARGLAGGFVVDLAVSSDFGPVGREPLDHIVHA